MGPTRRVVVEAWGLPLLEDGFGMEAWMLGFMDAGRIGLDWK